MLILLEIALVLTAFFYHAPYFHLFGVTRPPQEEETIGLLDVSPNAPPPVVVQTSRVATTNASPVTVAIDADTLTPHVRAGTPLRITYDGAERIIHPYRLGTNPRTGKRLLRAWEESKAGQPIRGFRTYAVSKIERATPIHGRAPIDLPDAAWRPDKTIPNPIAQRPAPTSQTHEDKEYP